MSVGRRHCNDMAAFRPVKNTTGLLKPRGSVCICLGLLIRGVGGRPARISMFVELSVGPMFSKQVPVVDTPIGSTVETLADVLYQATAEQLPKN